MARSTVDHVYFLKLVANLARTECRELGDWLESDEIEEAMALLDSIETSALTMVGHVRGIRSELAAEKEKVTAGEKR